MIVEANLDGIIGPSHHYAGLAHGNLASSLNKATLSNPRQAALQGLEKMKYLSNLGIPQLFAPPQERPDLLMLSQLGFTGTEEQQIEKAWKHSPEILFGCYSSSNMWMANAATITPSCDSEDGKVHITPANLISNFHRSIEAPHTARFLETLFHNPNYFVRHPPLPTIPFLSDEGAANHTRLCPSHSQKGFHIFVYGENLRSNNSSSSHSSSYSPRQSLQASQTICRIHTLDPQQTLFFQQNPKAIDKGVFHNDVISVGNENCFLFHEEAFINTSGVISNLKHEFETYSNQPLHLIQINKNDLSIDTAVLTYLFNSQLITLSPQEMLLLAPTECEAHSDVHHLIQNLISDSNNPISKVKYMNLKQSMKNGGGPACLRLRLPLTEKEIKALPPNFFLNNESYDTLTQWVKRHYREKLHPHDLSDPLLINEIRTALDELTSLLKLGSFYSFQK